MTWAAPLAGLLAFALVLPVVAHLWSRRRPTAVPFPTLRFLRETSPVSRRLRRVQDWPLLLLRAAIVALIAAAAAGPTLRTVARQREWQQRLHRVIVVDAAVSEGTGAQLERLADEATTARVFGPGKLGALLPAALADATRAARTQRAEVVVLWDGTRAALTKTDLASLPREVGLRLQAQRAEPSAAPRFTSPLTADAPVHIAAAAADSDARRDLLAKIRALEVVVPPAPIHIVWPGGPVAAVSARHTVDSARLGALDAIEQDARLRDAAGRSPRDSRARDAVPASARVLARSADGEPLLHGWWGDGALILALHATPSSPLALWTAVAAADAVSQPATWAASQPGQTWTPEQIAEVDRDASPPPPGALPGGLDTRVAWGTALLLLLLEQWWRRPRLNDAAIDAAPPTQAELESPDAA